VDTQLQFNDGGVFAGAEITYNKTTKNTVFPGEVSVSNYLRSTAQYLDITTTSFDVFITPNGTRVLDVGRTFVSVLPNIAFGFSTGATTAPDTVLARDAANTLAQRNGANAQTFRVYNSYTDAANGSWVELTASPGGGGYQLLAKKVGTGTAPNYVDVGIGPTVLGRFGTDLTLYGMSLLFSTDNTKDIGAAAANRPRNIYAAGIIKGKLTADNAAASGTITPTHTITIYDSGGTAYKVPVAV
jgi:hypothetical protein